MDVNASPLTSPQGKASPEVLRLLFERKKQRIEGRVFVCTYCQEETNLSCQRCHTPLCKPCEQHGRCCTMVMPSSTFVPAAPSTPQTGRVTEAASSSRGPQYDAEQQAREAVQGLANAASLASGDAEQSDSEMNKLIEEAQFICSICKTIGGSHLCCRACEYIVCANCISDESVPIACGCGFCDRRAWTEIQSKRQKIKDTRKKDQTTKY